MRTEQLNADLIAADVQIRLNKLGTVGAGTAVLMLARTPSGLDYRASICLKSVISVLNSWLMNDAEIQTRAARIKLLLMDCDGVLDRRADLATRTR